MKNLFNSLTILILGVIFLSSLFSCSEKESDLNKRTTVEGKILNYPEEIALFKYEAFKLFQNNEQLDVDIADDGSYKMILETDSPLKGFFSLGREPVSIKYEIKTVDGRDSSMQTSTYDFKMVYLWLEPGDSLVMNLDVEDIDNSLTFDGKGSNNNLFVNEEDKRFNDYKHKYLGNYYNITYREPDDYKSTVDELYREKLEYVNQFDLTNPISERLKNIYLTRYRYETVNRKLAYPGSHAMYNDQEGTNLPDGYYNFMDEIEFADEIGNKGIGYYYYTNTALRALFARESGVNDFYDFVKTRLEPKAYYEFLALSLGRDFKKKIYDQFGPDCPFPEIAQMVKDKYSHLEGMLEGNPAPDFTLTDVEGNSVSLDDLKGKYIYIDFWATWCGPCKEEIPYLKDLEKEYTGRNIHFVSISFDSEKDHGKWLNFVKDNEMTGIQLFADSASHEVLSNAFNIQLIPRFVMLDPEGRIVDANAPRPSDEKLRTLLENLGV